MNEDPPWLDEAACACMAAVERKRWESLQEGTRRSYRAMTRAVLAFAARQPLPITEAMVEAAADAIHSNATHYIPTVECCNLGRAALEAAEKERAR